MYSACNASQRSDAGSLWHKARRRSSLAASIRPPPTQYSIARTQDRAARDAAKTLNTKGMMRNPNLALSVADAAMSRLVTLCEYKADWRGRRIEKIDPWFPSTQACSQCGCIKTDMKNLNRRTFTCAACGHVEGRDRNAARNVYWYGEERRNRVCEDTTRGEIGARLRVCPGADR
jgi:transposase